MLWDWICIQNIASAWPGFCRKSSLFQIEMVFLGRSQSSTIAESFEWCKMSVFIFLFFFTIICSTIICFPVLMFGDLLPHHVGLCLIIALIFWCPNFIPLPCHLIMYCMQGFAAIFCFVFRWWLIYLHYWLMLGHVHSMRVLLWCAHVDGHTSAHIFLDCCPTGLASLAASFMLFFFFFVVAILNFFYCPLLYSVFSSTVLYCCICRPVDGSILHI